MGLRGGTYGGGTFSGRGFFFFILRVVLLFAVLTFMEDLPSPSLSDLLSGTSDTASEISSDLSSSSLLVGTEPFFFGAKWSFVSSLGRDGSCFGASVRVGRPSVRGGKGGADDLLSGTVGLLLGAEGLLLGADELLSGAERLLLGAEGLLSGAGGLL